MTRFTSLWEVSNPTATAQSLGRPCCLPSRPNSASRPICMMAMQKLKF